MSSNFGKPFTTTETTKAADAEVVSDSIELSPRTKNHVLVVKADNSVSGSVDVELEMSPDGNNWCPAVSKTVSGSSSSSSSSTGSIIGNEFHVKLTPDTVDGVTETKNKHGKGLLKRNLAADTAGSEADFMYHRIQTTKSFNYSQWIKSSEAPSATYNPVLFRHAGHDNFSNAKVVSLEESSSTAENGNSLEAASAAAPVNTRSVVVQDGSNATPASVFDLTTTKWSLGFWFKSDENVGSGNNFSTYGGTAPGGGGATYGRTLLMSSNQASHNFYGGFNIQAVEASYTIGTTTYTGIQTRVQWSIDGSNGFYDILSRDSGADLFDGQWHHLLIVKEIENPTASSETGFKYYLDGSLLTSTPFVKYGNPSFSNIQDKTSIMAGNGHTKTHTGGSLSQIHGSRSIASSFLLIGELDNICFWKSDQSSNAGAIYNSGKPLTTNPGSPTTYLRFENSSDLALNSVTGSTVSTHNVSFTTSNVQQHTLSSSDSIYVLGKLTQNLVASGAVENTKAVQIPDNNQNVPSAVIDTDTSYNKSPFYVSTDTSPTQDFPDVGDGFGISFWIKWTTVSGVTSWHFNEILKHTFTDGSYFTIRNLHRGDQGAGVRHLRLQYVSGSNYMLAEYLTTAITDGNWHYCTIAVKGTGTNGQLTPTTSTSTNDMKLYINGTEQTASAAGGVVNGSSGLLTFDSSTTKTIDTFKIGMKVPSANSTGDAYQLDNLAYYRGELNSTTVASIYQNRKNAPNATLASGTVLTALWRMGDGDNDVISPISSMSIRNIVSTNDIRLVDGGSTNQPSFITLSSSDAAFQSTANNFENNFDTDSNLSISGWFKTTDTGTLFSNGSSGTTTGLDMQVNASDMTLTLKDGSTTRQVQASVDVNDGQWHHVVVTKTIGTTPVVKIYIDGEESNSATLATISDTHLRGLSGFTLLGNGQNNAGNSAASSTDSSKLNASLSNWSIHSEVLDLNAVKQLYSNGNVRNIKNLPSVTASAIKAWWQLADTSNPQNDLAGSNHLLFFEPSYGNKKGVKKTSATANNNVSGINSATTINSALSSNWSISFWFKSNSDLSSSNITLDDYRYDMHLIGSDSISGGSSDWVTGFSLGVRGSSFKVTYAAGGSHFYQYSVSGANAAIFDGEWHNVTVVHSGTTSSNDDWFANAKLYIDGGSSLDKASAATLGTPGTVTAIKPFWGKGTNTSTGTNVINHVSGMIHSYDEMALWSGTALDSTARTALYNSGKPTDLQNTTNITAPTVYYRCEHVDLGYETISGSATTNEVNVEAVTLNTSGTGNIYVTPSPSLVSKLVNATGSTLIADRINGHGMTMSITKSFNFTTKKWVSTHDQDAAICLSFNGYQDQAEYFALWKCSQTLGTTSINVLDGNYHNIILSYRGRNDFSSNNVDPGDVVKFGPGDSTQAYNWTLSIDGLETTTINNGSGVDYIGGLNTISTATYNSVLYNVGFAIRDRHLKHTIANTEEVYKPHTQFSSGILDGAGSNKYAFQGFVDETSFHSDTWWVNQDGTSITANDFNGEKPATIFGNTTGASNRGAGKEYPQGTPYPLRNPEKLVTSGNISDIQGTNQFINPNPFDASSNPTGGLEAFWRWGDTSADCAETINDVKSAADGNNDRDISAENLTTTDVIALTSSDSTYITSVTRSSGSGGTTISFPQVKVTNIINGMKIFNIVSPLLQYLRVKWKGAGSVDIGTGKSEVTMYYTNRVRRRKN